MEKEKTARVDYRLTYIFVQIGICVLILMFIFVAKQFKLPLLSKITEWYENSFSEDTKVGTVTDTSSETGSELETSLYTYDDNTDTVNASLDLTAAEAVFLTSGKSVNSIKWPLAGKITSAFGYRNDPFTGDYTMHSGIDIAANSGTPIKAAATGSVIETGYRAGGYGNYVKIEHSSGFVTLYAHCSAIKVSDGQKVSVGDTVALVGSTGRSTGPHLHFEVRLHDTFLNPLWILPLTDEV